MLILGKNKDDKGTQLERLTRDVLQRRGFEDIICNAIGEGGLEVDVRAHYSRPGLATHHNHVVLCECKAHAASIAMPDWLKFLGKIYSQEAISGREVSGCFIALSGANGNVAGHYKSLQERNKTIELLEGTALELELHHICELCDLRTAAQNAAHYTARPVRRLEPFYYEGQAGWLITFDNDFYSLLNARGLPLCAGQERDALAQLIQNSHSVKQLVDLQAEIEAVECRLRAQMFLLSKMMQSEGTIALNQVENEIPDWADIVAADVKEAVPLLQARGLVFQISSDENRWQFTALQMGPDGLHLPVEERVQLFLNLLNPTAEVEALTEITVDGRLIEGAPGCDFYDRGIDDELVSFIQKQQGNLTLTEEEKGDVQRLCRLSPTALLIAVRPHPMFKHRLELIEKGEMQEDWENGWAKDFLLRQLCGVLEQDFAQPGLTAYFYNVRKMREIETHKRFIAKSKTEVILEQETSLRHGIGELASQYVGPNGARFVHVEMLPHAQQPWDSPVPQNSDDEDNHTS